MSDPAPRTLTKISRFLSMVLRHRPHSIGIKLDREGWANIADLIDGARDAGVSIDGSILREVVETNDKRRFAISADGKRIRAVQGHSAPQVDIAFQQRTPPAVLYHGTAERFLPSIRQSGLEPMTRQYVHLSRDSSTASEVGSRYGKAVVLTVRAREMILAGFKFFLAENGVWLTKRVPREFVNF